MNYPYCIILIITVLFTSCSNEENKVVNENETPETLIESNNNYSLSSYGRRGNIIHQLFNEALEKDQKLKRVYSSISTCEEIIQDSIADYNEYSRINKNYWNDLEQYSNQLNDTILKEQMKSVIQVLKDKHYTRTSSIDSIHKQIEFNEKLLEDQVIVMKILVTNPMMSNYQSNELPDRKPLESINMGLDSLINNLKPYTKIEK